MIRYTIRELLLFMLVVAVGSAWLTESVKAKQWRARAEIAAWQLEAENFGKMVFEPLGVRYDSPYKNPELQHTFFPTNGDD